jgi:hypothetical protein
MDTAARLMSQIDDKTRLLLLGEWLLIVVVDCQEGCLNSNSQVQYQEVVLSGVKSELGPTFGVGVLVGPVGQFFCRAGGPS